MKIKQLMNTVKFGVKKHSPEILVVSGIVGLVTGAVLACRATTKVRDILDERNKQLDEVKNTLTDETVSEAAYSIEDSKRDTMIINVQTGAKLAWLYAPAVALGVASAASILVGHNILKKHTAAIAAAYATVQNGFDEYRKRVKARFGEDVDKELEFGVKAKQRTEEVTDENGKTKTVKKTVNVANKNLGGSPYAWVFDENCELWERDHDYNMMNLRAEQQYATDKLRSRGYLYLNEVLERLGIPTSKMGQIVGWVYKPDNPDFDDFVDFGIRELEFDDGNKITLDFNVQGNILDLM